MGVYSLFVINKAGGLVFRGEYDPSAPRLENNQYLQQASIFHALYSCAQQLSPKGAAGGATGIKTMTMNQYFLQCFVTMTGVKFVATASKDVAPNALEELLKEVYRLYVDYVLKNPKYVLDNVIQCEKFTLHTERAIAAFNNNKKL
jgi:hypothetical protein